MDPYKIQSIVLHFCTERWQLLETTVIFMLLTVNFFRPSPVNYVILLLIFSNFFFLASMQIFLKYYVGFFLCLYWIGLKKRAGASWCFVWNSILQILQCLHTFEQFAGTLLYEQCACLNTHSKFLLFFSVLVDFSQVKPDRSESAKHHTD